MPKASLEELQESIKELTSYRDRLQKEISQAAQKLKMPLSKVDSILLEHSELRQINKVLAQLISQKKHQEANP